MGRSRSVVLALAVVACSNAGGGPSGPSTSGPDSPGQLRLVNATTHPFAFFVFAADLALLLDPLLEVRVGDPGTRVVPAGAEYRLGEIPGRGQAPDGGVAIYLYTLTADGSHARFTRVQLVSGRDIRQARGRIVIHSLQP